MRVLISTYSPECHDVDTAVVDIDPNLVLQRRELLQMVKFKDGSTHELSFWCGDAAWFRCYLIVDDLPTNEDKDRWELDNWAPLRDEGLIEHWPSARSDCDTMVITDDRVYWTALAKHGSGRYETEGIDYYDIIRMKEQSDGTSGEDRGQG